MRRNLTSAYSGHRYAPPLKLSVSQQQGSMIWKPTIRFGIPTGDTTTEIDDVSLAPHGQGYGVSTLAYLQYVRSVMLSVLSPTGRAKDSPTTHT